MTRLLDEEETTEEVAEDDGEEEAAELDIESLEESGYLSGGNSDDD